MLRYLASCALCASLVFGQSAAPLTNETVIRLVASGIPADRVIKTIQVADAVAFRFLPGDLQQLSQYKVPDDVVKAMAAKSNGRPAATTAPPPPAQSAPKGSPGPTEAVRRPPPPQVQTTPAPSVDIQTTPAQSETLDKAALSKVANWQDAILVSFRTVESGSSCSSSGTVTGEVSDSGNVTGRTQGNSNCVVRTTRFYTLTVRENTYVLRHELTTAKKAAVVATLGYGALFLKNSVLANQLPGTHVLVRSNAKGFWVKLGNRESKYEAVEAR